MNALISESRKLFSLRSTWIYLAVVSAGMAAGAVFQVLGHDINQGQVLVGDSFIIWDP